MFNQLRTRKNEAVSTAWPNSEIVDQYGEKILALLNEGKGICGNCGQQSVQRPCEVCGRQG